MNLPSEDGKITIYNWTITIEIVDLSIKHSDFTWLCKRLPEASCIVEPGPGSSSSVDVDDDWETWIPSIPM